MARGPKRPQKPLTPPRDENGDLDDEIDAVDKHRDVDDDVDMDDEEEYPVLGIEDSADDDSNEDKNDDDDNAKSGDKDIAKMKRQAKYMEQIVGAKDDLSDDTEPEKESQAVWGNKRGIYYERGGEEHESSDEEKPKVEEAEAVRLLKKRLHFLRMDDLDLPSDSDHGQEEADSIQERISQLRKMLDLLVHASQCRRLHCKYHNCLKVKGLFRHGIQCKTHASGGCPLCKKMWYLLQLHARVCKVPHCHVPRCKDLKEHLKMLQQ